MGGVIVQGDEGNNVQIVVDVDNERRMNEALRLDHAMDSVKAQKQTTSSGATVEDYVKLIGEQLYYNHYGRGSAPRQVKAPPRRRRP